MKYEMDLYFSALVQNDLVAGRSILIFEEQSLFTYHCLVSLQHLLQESFPKEIVLQRTDSLSNHLMKFFQNGSK